MLRLFEPWHLLILSGVFMVLFGAKRLPDSARSVGQSLRILRSETAALGTTTDQAAAVGPANGGAREQATTTPGAATAATTAAAPGDARTVGQEPPQTRA